MGALAVLPAAAAFVALDAWTAAAWLRQLLALSFVAPAARFLPPVVRVLVPVWLGTPIAAQDRLAAWLGLSRPLGGWPFEAPTLLAALVLAVLYGAEYGYRLSAAQVAQAARTGESAGRRKDEAATLADRSRDRDALVEALQALGVEDCQALDPG